MSPSLEQGVEYSDDIVEVIEDTPLRGSDVESGVPQRVVEIVEETTPTGSGRKTKTPRRFEERIERNPVYQPSNRRDLDDDIVEVIEDVANPAQGRKARTRIFLPNRFVHEQAFQELGLRITKEFEDRVQLESRGEVDLDVGFGSKEYIDRIVALGNKYRKRGWLSSLPIPRSVSVADMLVDTAKVKEQASALAEDAETSHQRVATKAGADQGKVFSSEDDDRPRASSSRASSSSAVRSSRTSGSSEVANSLEVIKVQCRPGAEPYAYISSIIAPEELVHRRAITQLGFRVIRKSREFWHAVPLATIRVGVEERSSKQLVEKMVALSKEYFEEGECFSAERVEARGL